MYVLVLCMYYVCISMRWERNRDLESDQEGLWKYTSWTDMHFRNICEQSNTK